MNKTTPCLHHKDTKAEIQSLSKCYKTTIRQKTHHIATISTLIQPKQGQNRKHMPLINQDIKKRELESKKPSTAKMQA